MNDGRRSTSARRLQTMRVAVVGLGGLGCPAALGLAGGGIGKLILIDPDGVESSNLPRQLLYTEADIGRPKVESAGARLQHDFPRMEIRRHRHALDRDNAGALLADADFIVDATDGRDTKLMINDHAVRSGKAFCHAGVVALRGQVLTVVPGRTPCVRCLFPDIVAEEEIAACSGAGIVGPIAGIFGALQASQALAYLMGDETVAGRLIAYDGLADRWTEIAVDAAPRCANCAALA